MPRTSVSYAPPSADEMSGRATTVIESPTTDTVRTTGNDGGAGTMLKADTVGDEARVASAITVMEATNTTIALDVARRCLERDERSSSHAGFEDRHPVTVIWRKPPN